MLSLISAELLKIRKRRATWIMYGVFLAFASFFLIAIRPIMAADDGKESIEFVAANLVMRFPMGFALLIRVFFELGEFILVVLAGLVVGSEFGWGTVRQVMARGASRNRYLGAKLAAIAVVVAIGMLLTLIIGIGIMVVGDLLVDRWDPDFPSGFASELAGDTLRTFGLVFVFAVLGYCIAILTRSAAGGVGLGLGFLFVETIFTGLFFFFGGVWRDVASFFLTNLANAAIKANRLGVGDFFGGPPIEEQSPVTAGLYLAVYVVVLLGISFWVFNRRDITGEG